MSQLSNLLGQVPHSVWTALVTAVFAGVLARAAMKRTVRTDDGWTPLEATLVMKAMSVFGLFLALVFALCGLVAAVAMIQDLRPDPAMIGLLAIAPPLAAMIGYGSLHTFLVRFRFNSEGSERIGFGRSHFVPWDDVARIYRHWFWQVVLEDRSGRWFMLPEYHRGFAQLIEKAVASGAPVDLN